MNLLLLAHLIADGEKAAEASNGPVWATWVPATIGLLGSLGVAWWSGRKTDRQMELSKQATPPELTRYKEWLDASEKYKTLVSSLDNGISAEESDEYKDIESSRRAALKRAVWERKVFSACPDANGQKRLLDAPVGTIVNGSKANFIPSFGSSGLTVLGIFFAILLILVAIASIALIVSDLWGNIFGAKGFATGEWDIASIILDILLILVILWAANHFINIIDAVTMSVTGKYFAEYGYLRIVQEDLSVEDFKDVLKGSSNGNSNAQRCIFALWDENYRNFVYCPEEFNSKFSYIWAVLKFGLPYWIINIRHKSRGYNYGEYRPEIFGFVEGTSEGEQTEQDEDLKGKKSSMSRRIVLWISKKWESLNRS